MTISMAARATTGSLVMTTTITSTVRMVVTGSMAERGTMCSWVERVGTG